jgi:hypothetical protein
VSPKSRISQMAISTCRIDQSSFLQHHRSQPKRNSTTMDVSPPFPDTSMSRPNESDSQASVANQMTAPHLPHGMNMSQNRESHHQQMDLSQLQCALSDALISRDMLQAQLNDIAASSPSSNECLFLDKLAPEIRNHIYGYLLINPLLSTGRSSSLPPACKYDSNVRYHPEYISLLLLDFTHYCNCISSKYNANMFSRTPAHVPKTTLTCHLQF